ncbi:MAG: hypothetical protein WBM54_15635 [Woeseia sp.]
MTAALSNLLLPVALWLALCATAAILVLRRARPLPLQHEQRFLLIGIGLTAVAPCTYLALRLLAEQPSLFASGVQLGAAALMFAAAYHARQQRLDPGSHTSSWVFQQKSAMVMLLALLILAFNYFGTAWSLPADEAIGAFIDSIILLVVLLIVGHIMIAVFHTPLDELDAPRDERDRSVDLYSMRNAYYALTAGFFTVPAVIIAGLPTAKALNLWFALLISAEVIYYSSIIAYYQFGTD